MRRLECVRARLIPEILISGIGDDQAQRIRRCTHLELVAATHIHNGWIAVIETVVYGGGKTTEFVDGKINGCLRRERQHVIEIKLRNIAWLAYRQLADHLLRITNIIDVRISEHPAQNHGQSLQWGCI